MSHYNTEADGPGIVRGMEWWIVALVVAWVVMAVVTTILKRPVYGPG